MHQRVFHFMNKIILFVGCILLAFLPALAGVVSKPDDWYEALAKPPLQPPPWIFAPVWTLLYLMIGIAHGFFCTVEARRGKSRGQVFYFTQLILNAAWSPIFFGLHQPLLAGLEIVVLLVMVVLTVREFSKVSPVSARLLYPYVAWLCFATYLNWGVVLLNPH